jgi:hypothetical protein
MGNNSHPNNSPPIIAEANGVFVAFPKTQINPIPANIGVMAGLNPPKVEPNVLPIKNKGVTSPPK